MLSGDSDYKFQILKYRSIMINRQTEKVEAGLLMFLLRFFQFQFQFPIILSSDSSVETDINNYASKNTSP